VENGSSTGAVLMLHADQLIEIATELAMDAKDNVADLRRKLSAVETAKVELEARLQNERKDVRAGCRQWR
jgi:hypothetical protein